MSSLSCHSLLHFFSCFCFVFSRLRGLWRRDQAGSVSPGAGETVARQLLQVSDLQHGPHGRVHQQVSVQTFESMILVFPFGKRHKCSSSMYHVKFLWHIMFSSMRCRDGVPYCEADYHAQYGVKCETCSRYISGRVLEVRTEPDLSVRCCKQTLCHAEFHNRVKWVLTTAA